MTYQLTQGVTKNIIPAIASTNAIIAAACTLEVLKTVTMCSTGMDNYMMCALRPRPKPCCDESHLAPLKLRHAQPTAVQASSQAIMR